MPIDEVRPPLPSYLFSASVSCQLANFQPIHDSKSERRDFGYENGSFVKDLAQLHAGTFFGFYYYFRLHILHKIIMSFKILFPNLFIHLSFTLKNIDRSVKVLS